MKGISKKLWITFLIWNPMKFDLKDWDVEKNLSFIIGSQTFFAPHHWNGGIQWARNVYLGKSKINIPCSLDIHSNLVKGEFYLLQINKNFNLT